jgi:hypothetical protein
VISVGGINDGNMIDARVESYHSSFGSTIDGFMKPELVAQAIWVAAPILTNTDQHREAHDLHEKLADNNTSSSDRETINKRIRETKFFSPDYMHVDGTSFATPIVSSVIAQLLQATPSLNPREIRSILFTTAKRLENIEAVRQGFGIIQPRKAIIKALTKKQIAKVNGSPFVNVENKTVEFYFEHGSAEQISVSGTFNNWAKDVLLLEPGKDGLWKIEIPLLPKGKYYYKFYVDGIQWAEDVENPYREPDGFNGWNSVLQIQ